MGTEFLFVVMEVFLQVDSGDGYTTLCVNIINATELYT
jgi:hypothetical protein